MPISRGKRSQSNYRRTRGRGKNSYGGSQEIEVNEESPVAGRRNRKQQKGTKERTPILNWGGRGAKTGP